jgi:hypothetical protein
VRTHFQAAPAAEETPAAWEGQSLAAWWRNDADAAFTARDHLPTLGERAAARWAARVAIWLAWDYLSICTQLALANG